jgi:hypothetical protein
MLCASASGANLRVDFSHAHALDMRQWHVRDRRAARRSASLAHLPPCGCAPHALFKKLFHARGVAQA